MGETVVQRSAGVTTREIDNTQPTTTGPVGVPAGVIGTAQRGPAFVPMTVASYAEWKDIFGSSDGEMFGPIAVNLWLQNATALTYLRVLGVGDGKKRNTDGDVTNAGFTVGSQQIQPNGLVQRNPFGPPNTTDVPPGRAYFLGCFMSESQGSTVFSDAGIQKSGGPAHPILRGVIFAASGVHLTLSSSAHPNGTGSATAGSGKPGWIEDAGPFNSEHYSGSLTGSVNETTGEFVMILNGLKENGANKRIITASFHKMDGDDSYFTKQFNTDPDKLEETGHYLYSHYDIHENLAVITGTGIYQHTASKKNASLGFLTTGSYSGGRASGDSTHPDFEGFKDRFRTAFSPKVISQKYGGVPYDLFKVHALSDGENFTREVKITIKDLTPAADSDDSDFGTFSLDVRPFSQTDSEYDSTNAIAGESYSNLSLDPTSDRFIARVIGDQRTYFNFDKNENAQKLMVDGDYPVLSNYIRIEQGAQLKAGQVPDDALPVGFRGPHHLVTSGSDILNHYVDKPYNHTTLHTSFQPGQIDDVLKRIVEPPVPFRENLTQGKGNSKTLRTDLTWGVQWETKDDKDDPNNANSIGTSELFGAGGQIGGFTRYYPMYHVNQMNAFVGDNVGVADSNGTILDADRFNNNKFTLENIKVMTSSVYSGRADPNQWISASYVRNGTITADADTQMRAFKASDLKEVGNRDYAMFTFFLQGGFDGVDTFNRDERRLLNAAAYREINDESNQGGLQGSTVRSYRKGIDVMGNTSDVDIKLLTIPGIRQAEITDYAIDAVESRFDAMYIMDIEERDTNNSVITSSVIDPDDESAAQLRSVVNTVTSFKNRALNTSFAAAYYPDLYVSDPDKTDTRVVVPPSVAVLGAYSLNDSAASEYAAPAGLTRGTFTSAEQAFVELNRDNLNSLYDASINPITDFPGSELTVWGQKTLKPGTSSLNRVNVRRLLIFIRRQVRGVGRQILFEPNRESTLSKFSSLVNPILQQVQERSGISRYKVQIDTTTTTQADIENNTIRGKIYLQPVRTAEFISLDFVLENT